MSSAFTRPPSETGSGDDYVRGPPGALKKRIATVYDAAAGRVSKDVVITQDRRSRIHQTPEPPLRPDEVLFGQQNAPARYAESDYYFAHANIGPDQQLPDSDLLRALHAYIASFYEKSEQDPRPRMWKSMDETTLIALGILVEETAREILGETGDLALLEAGEECAEESADDESEVNEDEEKHSPGHLSRVYHQVDSPPVDEGSSYTSFSDETE